MVNHNRRLQIPRMYTLLRWLFLVVIAISTALVGFGQSMLVSVLYQLRSQFIYSIVVRACAPPGMHACTRPCQPAVCASVWPPQPALRRRSQSTPLRPPPPPLCAAQQMDENVFVKFLQYAAFNLLLAWLCCFVMWVISPAASGSGIPDVKAYLNGVESPIFKNFFTIKTFIAKVRRTAPEAYMSLPGWAPRGVFARLACGWFSKRQMHGRAPPCPEPTCACMCLCAGDLKCPRGVLQPRHGQGGAHAARWLHFGRHHGQQVSRGPGVGVGVLGCVWCVGVRFLLPRMPAPLHLHHQGSGTPTLFPPDPNTHTHTPPTHAHTHHPPLRRSKWMQQQMEVAAHWGTYTYNKELRDLVAIGAACGVTTAFKAPVGGSIALVHHATRRGEKAQGQGVCAWIRLCPPIIARQLGAGSLSSHAPRDAAERDVCGHCTVGQLRLHGQSRLPQLMLSTHSKCTHARSPRPRPTPLHTAPLTRPVPGPDGQVGGVMFAMEMSTRWGKEITWRCFLACAITIVVVREAVNICSIHGHCSALKWGSLIWFQVRTAVRCRAVPACGQQTVHVVMHTRGGHGRERTGC